MTIAICVKVHDGLVLSSDSASTLFVTNAATGESQVFNVYEHADKVFNLRKGMPIALMTWGVGSIGTASIATLAKDLRQRLTEDPNSLLHQQQYTMQAVAERVRDYFRELYDQAYGDSPQKPALGFYVAGYGSQEQFPELWQVMFADGPEPVLNQLRDQDNTGITWAGEVEPISRLVLGFGTGLGQVLVGLGVPQDQVGPAMMKIQAALEVPFAPPPMPIQDAINLAEFLVHTAINWATYRPGPSTVGGPIEVAAITKHEGFRWVKRKYYFEARLNPPVVEIDRQLPAKEAT